MDNLLQDTAYNVSDGLFYPTTITVSCSWIVSTHNGTEWTQGGGLIPGCKEYQDHSDLGGQLGLAAVVSAIILTDGIKLVITIACAELLVLNQSSMDRSIIKAKLKHVDLISITSAPWENLQFDTVKEHVYGHQDDLNRPLTQLEELNCRMYVEAKDIALAYIK